MKYSSSFLKQAHRDSIDHEYKIRNSKTCGCFYCKRIYPPEQITEWIDEPAPREKTAVCPFCSIDSVLPDSYPIEDPDFIKEMHYHWFQAGT
ncbi:MAG: hypothetical protein AAF598_04095 [Bacteroidota bacterium]